MPPYPGFLGPTYQSASQMADQERLINWMLEPNESPSAPNPYVMLPTPGFTTLITVDQTPIRALQEYGGRVFFVAGSVLYELTSAGFNVWVAINRGSVTVDANPATISWNGPAGNELFITSGGVGYGYDLGTNTLTTVLASGATMGAYLSNRFLALDATTGTLQASNLLSTTFNPSMIVQRSAAPDPWVSMSVIHNEIWLWGARTGEVWYDAGAFPFPFEAIPGAVFEQGIAAPFSATRNGSPLQWIGQNNQGTRVVWQANGYQPQRVSTHGIEQMLASFSTVNDCVSFTYQQRGHVFYVPVFGLAQQAFHWDTTLGPAGWGERLFWNTTTASWEALHVSTYTYGFERHLVGDRLTGKIYQMDPSFYTDVDGNGMRRMRQPPRLAQEQKRVFYSRLQLVMDVGIGLSTGQGTDPQVMLQSSNDGGKTFGNERWVSAGPIGKWGTRVVWRRLGSARNRVDRFVVSDPVPFRIVDAVLDYAPGVS